MKHLLRAQEVAPMLQLSISGVYKAARCGHLPAYRVGRSVRFDEEEVMEAAKRKSNCLRTLREVGRG